MSKYSVIVAGNNASRFQEDFEEDYVEALNYYRDMCKASLLGNYTIQLIRENKIINQATFTDWED